MRADSRGINKNGYTYLIRVLISILQYASMLLTIDCCTVNIFNLSIFEIVYRREIALNYNECY